jgi:hypothetical protein
MAVLAACGGGATSGNGPARGSSGEMLLRPGFADGYRSARPVLVAGIPQRVLFVVSDDVGLVLRDDAPRSIDVEIVRAGTTTSIRQTVERRGEGIPTPYFPFVFTPPEPGDYEARVAFSPAPVPFRVAPRDALDLVQVGEPLRPVTTPTFADQRGVRPICTRSPDPCPFHELTLTEALAAGKPTIFIISTPGFCQTAICGPVLELLIEAGAQRPAVQIVHAEVYVEPNASGADALKVTPAVTAYGLDYEPSMYVAGADGIVRSRLDFSWDRTELAEALDAVG